MAIVNRPSDVTVVVVSFNTQELLRACLASIEPGHEVVVVDNASTDGSVAMVQAEFSHVKLIANTENRGFGPANNQGIDAATRPFVLFLNSDAEAYPGSIAKLAEALQPDDVAAVGGRLLNPDGSLQDSSANALTLWAVYCEQFYLEKLFPNSALFSPYWNTRRLNGTSQVEQVMGACLMIKPVERFDERFFLYCEDTELCHRLRKHGKILYVPDAPFTHRLGSSSSANRWRSVALYNRGKELYFQIWGGRWRANFCWWADRKGAGLRMLAWLIPAILTLGLVGRFREKVVLFAKVLTAPLAGPHPLPRKAE